ncbi:hypothetical protein ASE75_12760 [Sphingomonas sp. Leaf17]|uniref:hypothetical protein n=1 Tax=Sphingomonas sp. Leaf17 TaxID=1735683 RepID=UPI0006FA0AC2|nr:hypothetical protein [Sphingomonas sp. Leaf17]KQM63327.1 hypothetical protein ASE75_12760 [Sphingomonas sp. Leaf17]
MSESRTRIIIGHPDNEADHHRRWATHVAAGRIGTTRPTPPDIAQNRDRWTALFRNPATPR